MESPFSTGLTSNGRGKIMESHMAHQDPTLPLEREQLGPIRTKAAADSAQGWTPRFHLTGYTQAQRNTRSMKIVTAHHRR